jgi:uncharacterized protein (TIGR00725 family)
MRQIAVAVHSGRVPGLAEKARQFVEALAARCPDAVLLVGGYWGHMVDVVDAALQRRLRVVLFLPVEKEDVDVPPQAIALRTGCEYRCRSVLMIRSADAVVVLGGGVGTMIEALMAYAMGKPFFVLANVGAASDRLQTAYPEYFDERKAVKAVYEEDPVRLAELVCAAEKGAVTNFG